MLPEIGHPAEPEVGERAHGERHAQPGEAADQGRVVHRAVAVVDPVHPQPVNRLGDIGRRPFLAGMGDEPEARFPRRGEEAFELRGRIVPLGRVEAEAGDPPVGDIGLGVAKGGEPVLLVEMPEDAHDEQRGDAEPLAPISKRGQYAVRRDREGNAARGVTLGIEEHLDMHRPIGGYPLQIGCGELVEVLLGTQHVHAPVVDVEEVLQPGEAVGGPYLLDRAERDLHLVAGGHPHHQFRLERPLQMQVKLGLGQRPDMRSQVHSGLRCHPLAVCAETTSAR